ncbi:ferredoxin [Patescibacteria group bacterium AH-259-L07]|nr:ferredoxin [Patescibacteria group bacterium AH-259-L07]
MKKRINPPKFSKGRFRRVKVIYDRENCIGAGSCAVVAPQFWKMKPDGKANLLNSKINKKTGNYELELEVDEEMLAILKDSEDACPVRVIKVIEIK